MNWRLWRRNKLITRDHQYEPHLVQIHETSKIIHSWQMLMALLFPWKKNKRLSSNKNYSELKINLRYNLNLNLVYFSYQNWKKVKSFGWNYLKIKLYVFSVSCLIFDLLVIIFHIKLKPEIAIYVYTLNTNAF